MPSRHRIARVPARLAVATALILPASAIAAPAVDDSSPAGRGDVDSPAAGAHALVTGHGAGLAADPPQGPYVPVAAPVA
jgi:hypothetical protein